MDLGAIDLGGLFVAVVASRDEGQTLAQKRRISTSTARIGWRFAEKSRVGGVRCCIALGISSLYVLCRKTVRRQGKSGPRLILRLKKIVILRV